MRRAIYSCFPPMLNALRIAVRQLSKAPGFTVTALATLAICFGANLTIFAVVDAILLRPLPFPAADRLVTLFNSYPGAGLEHIGASIPNYFDRRYAIRALASVSIYHDSSAIVGDVDSPKRVPAARISPEFFSTLGVPLAMGDAFTDAQLPYGADQVAVLTDGFWRSHFNADPNVLGRTFLNDGLTITVVGVLPPNFHFLSSHAEFYRPASYAPEDRQSNRRHSEGWEMVARLSSGSTLAEAQAQINTFNAQQMADDPMAQVAKSIGYQTTVAPLHADYVRSVRPMLVLLQCGSLSLLMIGGVNLANLMLIRASGRSKDFAIRQALGARQHHLFLGALPETTLLALAGAGCGLLIGAWGVELLPSLGVDKLPLGGLVAFDWRITAVALGAAILAACILAFPAYLFSRHMRPAVGLQGESRGATASRATQRMRHSFIVVQIALAFVLLSSAGLLGLSLKHVLETPVGFDPNNILTGNIALPWKNYKDEASRLAFVERLLSAVHSVPGVMQAAITTALPFNKSGGKSGAAVEGITGEPGDTLRTHEYAAVTGDYWPAMRIRILRGRVLEDADNYRMPHVCVVDQAFAEHYWPGADPIGHRITPFDVKFDKENAFTIVGVVASVKQSDVAEREGDGAVYLPFGITNGDSFALVVRSTLPTAAIAPMVQKAFQQIDPGLPIDDLRPMQSRIDDSLVARRSPAILSACFSAVALLLAAIGTYGVLSYSVSQRRREIGVRLALGAQPQQVRNQFVAIGFRLLIIGTIIGAIGAWIASRAIQSILYDIPALPAAILACTAVVLAGASLTACILPARRAARVDPSEALRSE
jgi:predicted permease